MDLKIFFQPQDHQYLLDIMPVYHNMQNQTNLMIQTRENGRKPQIWANLGKFGPMLPNFGPNIFGGAEIFFGPQKILGPKKIFGRKQFCGHVVTHLEETHTESHKKN